MNTHRCIDCREVKPWDDFYPRKRADDGTVLSVLAVCRPCSRERSRAWAKANRETVRAKKRRAHARLMQDPEWAATRRVYCREWYRARYDVKPERQWSKLRDGSAPLVEAAPVLAAVEAHGLPHAEVEQVAGVGSGTLRKAFTRERMRAATAVAILGALGLDPVDVGC